MTRVTRRIIRDKPVKLIKWPWRCPDDRYWRYAGAGSLGENRGEKRNHENLALGRVPDDRQSRGPGLTNRWRRSRGTCLSLSVFRNVVPRKRAGAIINISYSLWAAEWQRPFRSSRSPRPLLPSPSSLSRVSSCSSFFLAFLPPCVIHVDLGGPSLKFLVTIALALDVTGLQKNALRIERHKRVINISWI